MCQIIIVSSGFHKKSTKSLIADSGHFHHFTSSSFIQVNLFVNSLRGKSTLTKHEKLLLVAGS